MFEGFGRYYQDDFAAAMECAEKSISLMLRDRLAIALPMGYLLSALVSHSVGELAKAHNALEEAMKVARDSNQKQYAGQARICLGRLIIDEDSSRVTAAEQSLVDGLKMVEDLQLKALQAPGYLFLGETYAIAGKGREALASLKKAWQMCQEMGMDYWLARTEKALEKLKASG